MKLIPILMILSALTSPGYTASSNNVGSSHVHKKRPKISLHSQITNMSRLSPSIDCLEINNPSNLTGFALYQNVTFDPQMAVNPTDPKNIVIVTEQDTLANAQYNTALPLSIVVLYTLDGGITWNESDLVLSRCQGASLFLANNNFQAAYFPSVTFDPDGNCYVLSTSYNIFDANQQIDINLDEGNIVAKSVDGGKSWNQLTAAFRDDGSCHYFDFPQIKADPYRKNTIYIVAADDTCIASGCTDPDYNGNQNIIFQKSTDATTSWSDISLIASFPIDDPDVCTPNPTFNQIEVLHDKYKTLLVTSLVQYSPPDTVATSQTDRLLAWRSRDGGNSWHMSTIAGALPHVIAVDPDSNVPVLPVTSFLMKDMAVNSCNGKIYVVYSDPQFNPTGQAGCVIRMSSDGGKHWSKPVPINPHSLDVQTFLPAVAVAKDGTVGVLFYDFRYHTTGDSVLSTDVWLTFFDENLKQQSNEIRITEKSFDARKAIRGYNGVDQMNCNFDYFISNHVGLKANGDDFIAAYVNTNDLCNVASIATFPCDSFPLFTESCNRQNVNFVTVKRRCHCHLEDSDFKPEV